MSSERKEVQVCRKVWEGTSLVGKEDKVAFDLGHMCISAQKCLNSESLPCISLWEYFSLDVPNIQYSTDATDF